MLGLSTLQPVHAPRVWYAVWWMAWVLVLIASLLPMPRVGLDVSHGDKWLHLITHGTLACYAWLLFRPRHARWAALAGLVGLGVGIEGLQSLVPWRSADGWDLLANGAGTLLGCLAGSRIHGNALKRVDRWLFGARSAVE